MMERSAQTRIRTRVWHAESYQPIVPYRLETEPESKRVGHALLAGSGFLEPWIQLGGADCEISDILATGDLIDKPTANHRNVS